MYNTVSSTNITDGVKNALTNGKYHNSKVGLTLMTLSDMDHAVLPILHINTDLIIKFLNMLTEKVRQIGKNVYAQNVNTELVNEWIKAQLQSVENNNGYQLSHGHLTHMQ